MEKIDTILRTPVDLEKIAHYCFRRNLFFKLITNKKYVNYSLDSNFFVLIDKPIFINTSSNQNISDFIQKYKFKKYVIVHITIYFPGDKVSSHANLLIIDFEKKETFRFEPHGSLSWSTDHINSLLDILFKNEGFTFFPTAVYASVISL